MAMSNDQNPANDEVQQLGPEALQPARTGMRRRDFLALGSALAAAPLVERAAAAAALAKAVAKPAARPISVGYLEGSAYLKDLRHLAAELRLLTITRQGDTLMEGRRVVPANTLPGGDASFAGTTVRISIRGLYPPLPVVPPPPGVASSLPRAIDLDISVPSVDLSQGAGYLFQAWSYRRLPAPDLSAPLSFVISPDWYSDFAVTFGVVPALAPAGARPRISRTAFTLGADLGRPRLQAGAYLLGINPGSWDESVNLPDDANAAGSLLSVLMTVAPEGISLGRTRR
jgi:hypothetical protein